MNLTQTTKVFKNGLKLLLAVAVLYYLSTLLVFPVVRVIISNVFPEKNPPQPNFGMLPPLTLIEKPINQETPKYTLNTSTGRLPNDFPQKMVVYRFIERQTSLLRGTEAISDAEFLGFTEEDLSSDLKGDTYTWSKRAPSSNLSIDLNTSEIVMKADYERYPDNYPRGTLTMESATKIAENLFKKLRRFDDNLYTTGRAMVYFGSFQNDRAVRAENSRDTQFARVDLYRKIMDYPILGQDPHKGLLHVIVKSPSKSKDPLNYPEIEANYREIETEPRATYPIISVNDAWKAVSNNKGVITSVLPRDFNPFEPYTIQRVDNILIDNVYLAYYETKEKQEYLQPIYVFSGKYSTRGTDGGAIVIYYPAVSGEYIRAEKE